MIVDVPRPRTERQSIEEELAELPAQLASYRSEQARTPREDRVRWQYLDWQIRNTQNRLKALKARLAEIQKTREGGH
jgi:hypothetical protein